MLALFALFLVSQVVLNEVMANPSGRETGTGAPGRRNEFVEIFNNAWRLNIKHFSQALNPYDSLLLP